MMRQFRFWICFSFLLAIILAIWQFQRWQAVELLRREANIDVSFQCFRRVEVCEKNQPLAWLFATKVRAVAVTGELKEPKKMARALAVFGSIEEMTCSKNQPQSVDLLLDGFVAEQSIKRIYLSNVEIGDSTIQKLRKCSNLSTITLVGGLGNAESWPDMNSLEDLDASFTPISDMGFKQIITVCPKLKRIQLQDANLTMLGIESAIELIENHRCVVIIISGIPGFNDDWYSRLLRKKCNLELRFD